MKWRALLHIAEVWWRGATASQQKIFRGLQNWAQDQHIEYAWLSFHPTALIQYSQRGWWKKKKKKRSSWHWPRWLLGHLSFSIISKSRNFPNYHLMYLATFNGRGAAYLHSCIIKSQSKHRNELPGPMHRTRCLWRLMRLASRQIRQGFMPALGNDNGNDDNLARHYDTIIKYSQAQVPAVCVGVCLAHRSCRPLDTHHLVPSLS